eukprot:3470261-Prorocentrum_lima.AAC.1
MKKRFPWSPLPSTGRYLGQPHVVHPLRHGDQCLLNANPVNHVFDQLQVDSVVGKPLLEPLMSPHTFLGSM